MSFQIAHILCLASPPFTALRQAVHVAAATGARLHVRPLPLFSERSVDPSELSSQIDRLTADTTVNVSAQTPQDPEDAAASLSAVFQYVVDANVDLVVTDPPPEHGQMPPLAEDPTRTLVTHLACPLFVVGPGAEPASIHRVLVPTDLTDQALETFQHAATLATLYHATVDVLYVIDSIPYIALTPIDRLSLGSTPLAEHRGRRQLRAFLRDGNIQDVSLQSHLAYGDPAEQIGHFAEENEIDLVVLCSHGTKTQPDRPLGQVAERVLTQVSPPLVLFPTSAPSRSSDDAGPLPSETPTS